jgi:hypothetical protein
VSQDLFVSFAPVPVAREELADRFATALMLVPAKFLGEFNELAYHVATKEYRSAFGVIQASNLRDGVRRTAQWQGVSCEYELPRGGLSVVFWNDGSPMRTSFMLWEDSSLYTAQKEHSEIFSLFQDFMFELCDGAGASFCLMQRNARIATIQEADLAAQVRSGALFERLDAGAEPPIFLAIRSQLAIEQQLMQSLDYSPSGFESHRRGDYLILKEQGFGSEAG